MATKTLQVKINQGIIGALGRKLYNRQFASVVLREGLQNAIDSLATKIDLVYDAETFTLTITDNGRGIPRIEGLMDTIGESEKYANSIGGYGLAKLAIFACQFWKFQSTSGSFASGYNYDSEDTIKKGTILTARFESSDLSWQFESETIHYLRLINRKVKFTYNGEVIKPYDYDTLDFGNYGKIQTVETGVERGYIHVRVNGLPTFRKWIANYTQCGIVDYQVNLNPYHPDYPLSSNRDNFIEGCAEYNHLENLTRFFTSKLERDKRLEENKMVMEAITKFRGKNYVSVGDVTQDDYNESSMVISTYKRYLEQIAVIMYKDIDNCQFGLAAESSDFRGLYNPDIKSFAIRLDIKDKGEILQIAMHEFAHFMGYGLIGHDQSFVTCLDGITTKVLNSIFEGEFRK